VCDISYFATLRLHFLLKACSQQTNVIREIPSRYESLFGELDQANSHFSEVEYGVEAADGSGAFRVT
jgi:hypothetical protein